jgi:hypothetical protein
MIAKPMRSTLLGALGLLLTMGTTVMIDTHHRPAHAQTAGMERREERRNARQQSRELKHECNASGQHARAECRQEKHHYKQSARSERWHT